MKTETRIKCPHCSGEIDVNQIVYNNIGEELKNKYLQKITEEKKELEIKLRKAITEETTTELIYYKKELTEKVEQVKELSKTKAELERARREKDELKEKIEAESEQKLSRILSAEKERIRKELDDRNVLKVAEKEHVIEQLKNQLKEAHRKAEQGSMQLQGEVQEIAIETYLRDNFPFDEIEEIKKGARGADCMQIINSRLHQNCGRIYYESKNTKDFQNVWIEKFRTDMREKGADIGVLVTEVYPKGIERMTLREGIWICSVDEFKGLCFVLRESLLMLNSYSVSQENKGEKMQMLYNYLIGTEFKMQVEGIVEGFMQMNIDLEKEMVAMNGIWKKRKKQLEKVLLNTNHMFSSIKGIAGESVSSIKLLELPDNKTSEL
ncbi:MAG: DUF2130 domain-containing protein [Bacteroidia bacterium]